MSAPASFVREVNHALAHLYDPEGLRGHPLLGHLGLTRQPNPKSALRQAILEAIESLKPQPSVPVDSREWRVYRLLTCRYVHLFGQEQTAHQLGLSVRHLRREERAAVRALADTLFSRISPSRSPTGSPTEPADGPLEGELAWLRVDTDREPAVLEEALQAALAVVAILAKERETSLEPPVDCDAPPLAVHRDGLTQAIISATTCGIRRVPGGRLRFSAAHVGHQVKLLIEAFPRGVMAPTTEADQASLRAAGAILRMCGGSVDVSECQTTLKLALTLPVAGAVDVLMLDDNTDLAQLFARYLAGTRYRLRHTSSADSLFDLIGQSAPAVIIVDVMMPQASGWEILARLRQHPLTEATPTIACTILPEPELAQALGATVFLHKPVSRKALLDALRQALGEQPPTPR
jgi:CheY-like chemotaxis protein